MDYKTSVNDLSKYGGKIELNNGTIIKVKKQCDIITSDDYSKLMYTDGEIVYKFHDKRVNYPWLDDDELKMRMVTIHIPCENINMITCMN